MALIPIIELSGLWVDDVPVSPTRADFVDENGDAAQISGFDSWSAYMLTPEGEIAGTLTGTDHGQHLEFQWPEESILLIPGIYSIVVQFQDPLGVNVSAEPYRFVVQAIDGWLDLEQARSQWPDAPLDDVLLYQILESAREQCEDYAPALAVDALPPLNYLQAQLMQSRALHQSVIANKNDNVGIEGFAVRVFPLDFTIRALLRPKKAIGGMY